MINSKHEDMYRLVDDTLVLILAGGQGSRLHELTESRAKPGLEFGGGYKIIDFPLSNCVNSGLKHIGVITQYKSQCLIRHLVNGWAKFNSGFGEFLELIPAAQQTSEDWYRGTADSLFQNIAFIKSVMPKYVLVLSGDHIYKMDYRHMLEEHVKSGADMTVSCIEVPTQQAAGQFGVMSVDAQDRIISFAEKPINPDSLEDRPGYTLASMGNYVFNTEFLINQLQADARDVESAHDFGKDIIPKLIMEHHINAFRFRCFNSNEQPYWRDVGTLDAYWQANLALLEPHPSIDLYDQSWPIWSTPKCLPPIRFTLHNGSDMLAKQFSDSLIAPGCILHECEIRHSLVNESASIGHNANVSDSILLPNVKIGKNVRIHKAIVDTGCIVPDDMQIGVDVKQDLEKGFRVSEYGVVLITQKMLDQHTLQQAVNKAKSLQVKVHSLPEQSDLPATQLGVSAGGRRLSIPKASLLVQ